MLAANPDLSRPDSPYRDIVESFMYKLLQDPDPIVRQPAMLAFETNSFYSPSPRIIKKIQEKSKGHAMEGEESKSANTILASYSAGEYNPPDAGAQTANPLEPLTGGAATGTSRTSPSYPSPVPVGANSPDASLDQTSYATDYLDRAQDRHGQQLDELDYQSQELYDQQERMREEHDRRLRELEYSRRDQDHRLDYLDNQVDDYGDNYNYPAAGGQLNLVSTRNQVQPQYSPLPPSSTVSMGPRYQQQQRPYYPPPPQTPPPRYATTG